VGSEDDRLSTKNHPCNGSSSRLRIGGRVHIGGDALANLSGEIVGARERTALAVDSGGVCVPVNAVWREAAAETTSCRWRGLSRRSRHTAAGDYQGSDDGDEREEFSHCLSIT